MVSRGPERLARVEASECGRVLRVPAAAWREGSGRFPRLEVSSLPGLFALQAEALAGALCVAAAAGRSRAVLVAGALLLAHAAFGAARRVARSRRNARERRVWAAGFPGRLDEHGLAARVAGSGARFVLHVRRYEGRFAGEALEPAAWLEDRAAGLAWAIAPASFATETLCRVAGVAIQEAGAARSRREPPNRLDPAVPALRG
jgi:hypothetical protein